MRVAELERQRAQLGDLGAEAWAKIDEASQAALAKLAAPPDGPARRRPPAPRAASGWSRRSACSSTSNRCRWGPAPSSAADWPSGRTLRLATRGSPLARRQTDMVVHLLAQAQPRAARPRSRGRPDRGRPAADEPLERIGGQGVFVKEIQQARAGRAGRRGRALGQGPAAP